MVRISALFNLRCLLPRTLAAAWDLRHLSSHELLVRAMMSTMNSLELDLGTVSMSVAMSNGTNVRTRLQRLRRGAHFPVSILAVFCADGVVWNCREPEYPFNVM
jgi:hypothetical protein